MDIPIGNTTFLVKPTLQYHFGNEVITIFKYRSSNNYISRNDHFLFFLVSFYYGIEVFSNAI